MILKLGPSIRCELYYSHLCLKGHRRLALGTDIAGQRRLHLDSTQASSPHGECWGRRCPPSLCLDDKSRWVDQMKPSLGKERNIPWLRTLLLAVCMGSRRARRTWIYMYRTCTFLEVHGKRWYSKFQHRSHLHPAWSPNGTPLYCSGRRKRFSLYRIGRPRALSNLMGIMGLVEVGSMCCYSPFCKRLSAALNLAFGPDLASASCFCFSDQI